MLPLKVSDPTEDSSSDDSSEARKEMSWREAFLIRFGAGAFAGITFGRWLRVLRHNHFAVHRPYWGRAAVIALVSIPIGSSNRGPSWRLLVAFPRQNGQYGRPRIRPTAIHGIFATLIGFKAIRCVLRLGDTGSRPLVAWLAIRCARNPSQHYSGPLCHPEPICRRKLSGPDDFPLVVVLSQVR